MSIVEESSDYEYWPFTGAPTESPLPRDVEKVEFLRVAHAQGYESFRFGINNYGAKSGDREGCILERGRNRWEIRLAEGEYRRLSAFVNVFPSAGRAVHDWLGGSCPKAIIEAITDRLVTPPGAKASHMISDGDCNT